MNRLFNSFSHNIILNTDSYKVSHYLQYPPGTEKLFSYIESRGGRYDRTLFFGLQMFLKEYLSVAVTYEMVEQAKAFYAKHLPGVPFNESGWRYIVDTYGGLLPVRIRAVPEGSVVPIQNVLVSVESLDKNVPWISQHIEAAIMRATWYPITVATQSWFIKQRMRDYLQATGAPLEGLSFMLHDFGARGVSSLESAAIGGAAHLVNFMGTDTIPGALAAATYYGADMAGFSIAAAEHSTITAWGRDNEVEAYRNMIRQFGKPGSIFAVVSDSYDIYHAVDSLWGESLKQDIINSGATLVIRPDSGDPVEVVTNIMLKLHRKFGSKLNSQGYRVLNNVKVIQGDGINEQSIEAILESIACKGFSAENIAFGMGGALLQQLDRDTQKFAKKMSWINVKGEARDVYKDPVTDSGKISKRGLLTLIHNPDSGEYRSVDVNAPIPAGFREELDTVFENGEILREQSFDEIRARSDETRLPARAICMAANA